MIVTERDFMAQKEYYKDQMRAAERYQLARRARAEGGAEPRFYAQALTWVKRRFAAWMSSHQERYEGGVPPAVPQPQ